MPGVHKAGELTRQVVGETYQSLPLKSLSSRSALTVTSITKLGLVILVKQEGVLFPSGPVVSHLFFANDKEITQNSEQRVFREDLLA